MTVAEMIAQLVKYNPSTPVRVTVPGRWDHPVVFPVALFEDVDGEPCIRISPADVPT
jgi:hypothetical protein